ncbi:response regulator transcription factor [Sphingobium aquiterrae]|uniref:response regulator transcription factor n=1 Tax=Sphingobium aquiterrae TaxID=2038656 RepID=UPI0030179167
MRQAIGYTGERFYLVGPQPLLHEASVMLAGLGFRPRHFETAAAFLNAAARLTAAGVLIALDPDQGTGDIATIAARKAAQFVIVQTATADVPFTVAAVHQGAVDILVQPCHRDALIQAIRAGRQQRAALSAHNPGVSRFHRLSDRERDVLDGLAAGLTNKAIALDLGISHRTVEVHRARLMRKLGVASLPEALEIAFSHRRSRHGAPCRMAGQIASLDSPPLAERSKVH